MPAVISDPLTVIFNRSRHIRTYFISVTILFSESSFSFADNSFTYKETTALVVTGSAAGGFVGFLTIGLAGVATGGIGVPVGMLYRYFIIKP